MSGLERRFRSCAKPAGFLYFSPIPQFSPIPRGRNELAMQIPLFWQVVLLAIVQGVAEFLPISSSGHVVVLAALMGYGDTNGLKIDDLNIALHVGTLFSILVFYWQRIWRLLGEDRRAVGLLVLGTIPAVVIGLPLKAFGSDALLNNPLTAGLLFPVTGLVLLWAARHARDNEQTEQYHQLTVGQTLLIGLSQAAAILPGLSRSGTTISAGMRLGLAPRAAATFSFLLAIPVIAGAGVLETWSMAGHATGNTPLTLLLLGLAISFAVGLVSLSWLIRWLERGRLHLFAWWCIPLGFAVVVWQLLVAR